MNIRRLCGRCVQTRTFSLARSFCANNEHVEKLSEQFQSAGASSTKGTHLEKENIENVQGRTSESVETIQDIRASVAERLIMNEVDEEMLVFPEVVEKSQLDKINAANTSNTSFFRQHLSIVDKNRSVFDNLKQMDAFKHNIQSEYGGLAYSATESTLASEPEGHNVSIALALSAHRNVCSAIGEFGSIWQKEKYLPRLASGELIGTSCINEKQSDESNYAWNTKAELDDDADEYIINGSKVYVLNSINSQLFLVFAQTRTSDMLGDMNDSLSAFLVEANAPGVTIGQRDETIGSQNLYQSTVTFNNVRVKSGK